MRLPHKSGENTPRIRRFRGISHTTEGFPVSGNLFLERIFNRLQFSLRPLGMNRDNLTGRFIILHLDAVADLEFVVAYRLSVAGDLRGPYIHAEPLRLAVGQPDQEFAMAFLD